LQPEAALARASAFYEAGQYAQCAEAFRVLLGDPTASSALAPRSREQASVYRAACLIAQGKGAAADDVFRLAIRETPQMVVPSAILFPPAVIERFIVVRTTLLEEIRRAEEDRAYRQREAAFEARRRAEAETARVARLERLASQETIVAKNRRWVASVPFGIGQFQNRDYGLGATFLLGEALLLGTAITATSIELSLISQAKGGAGITDPTRLNASIKTASVVSLAATGALLVVAAGGILEANLAFVPEFSDGVRLRPRPGSRAGRAPGVVPLAGPVPGGAEIGVAGRF
jgi:hypothetical protein